MSAPARLRGSHFQTFWQVILPLAGPALAAVGVLQFQGTWNGLFWPPLMALVVITTIPILALYIYFQRYFVEGIAAAGVKG